MVAGMPDLVPGQGIDMGGVGRVLLIALAVYVVASLLSWWQGYVLAGAVQRTIHRLRRDVEAKLHRLPLPYFDNQPRGELLSRVTNDIDNVAHLVAADAVSQLLTSLLTVVAMVAMMLYISPLLALIALVTIPMSMVLTGAIAKRSQVKFVAAVEEHRRAQRAHRGDLHRARPGQGVRPPARGRRSRSGARTPSCSTPPSAPSSSAASSCPR